MISRTTIVTVLVIILSLVVKAHVHGIKLIVLAALGVASLYMIHKLAQDYNKYQTSHGRILEFATGFIGKRSLSDFDTDDSDFATELKLSYGDNYYNRDQISSRSDVNYNEIPDFGNILSFDPRGCARRYVCTIATKSMKKLSQQEKNILAMMRRLPRDGKRHQAQQEFIKAIKIGERTRDQGACAAEYPKCTYSISQMLKMIGQ